jgi:serine/threonine protein kinase
MSTNNIQPPMPSKSGARRTNALPSGYMLDEYRIEAILGAGGFGVTYKALDTHLNAWVAIKEYFPVEWSFRDSDGVMVYANTQGLSSAAGGQMSDYEWGLERFLDEARVLAQIQHPYVVRVKRYFRANGTAYIVMEYEEGEPLSTMLDENGTLGEEGVRGLLEDVLPALRAVHDQGYLHRDIKPANLYVRSRDRRVMLIDFGAARAAIGRHSQNVTSLVTPGYSPPEQYTSRNDRYGTWTDLYALGAVLYRCVTGHTPAEAAERLLDDHLVSAVAAGAGRYSANLLQVIDRALAVRPEMRFRDVAEMQVALMGARGDDSDETVIVAPVVKPGKHVQKPTAWPETSQPPTEPGVSVAVEEGGPQTARPAVESPRSAAGRREVLSPASATSPPRRRPAALLAGGVAALALAALVVAWLWPSAPEPSPPPHGQDTGGQPVQPLAEHPSPPPVAGTPESTTTSPPPAEVAPAAGTLPAEPAAPSVGAPPPIVETTVREPTPTTESGTPPSVDQPTAPLLEHEGQIVQPVQFQEEPTTAQPVPLQEEPATEKVPEPAATGITAPPPPGPALAPTRIRPPRSGAAVEGTKTKQQGADKKAPTREAEPVRSRTARKKERRGRTQPPPVIATPAPARVPSPPPVGTRNPWEPPASTGFNQK